MTTQNSLGIIVYAPALVGNDRRTLDIVHGMENALPGLRLEWRLSDSGRPIALPQRDAWLAEGTKDGGFPLMCNGDESYPVMISGLELPAGSSPGGQAQFEVHAQLPPDAIGIAAAADVLEAVGEGARAFWGHVDPEGVAVTVSEQFRHPGDDSHVPPEGLPSLKLPGQPRALGRAQAGLRALPGGRRALHPLRRRRGEGAQPEVPALCWTARASMLPTACPMPSYSWPIRR